jgi:cell wall-associated NlpC family hydrolase
MIADRVHSRVMQEVRPKPPADAVRESLDTLRLRLLIVAMSGLLVLAATGHIAFGTGGGPPNPAPRPGGESGSGPTTAAPPSSSRRTAVPIVPLPWIEPVDARTAALAATLALRRIGTPYVWGGTSPRAGLDCSALVQWAYRRVGIELPRTTWQQRYAGVRVPRSQMRRGDLVFRFSFAHVGMYLGHDRWIEASSLHGHVITQRLPSTFDAVVRPVSLLPPARLAALGPGPTDAS